MSMNTYGPSPVIASAAAWHFRARVGPAVKSGHSEKQDRLDNSAHNKLRLICKQDTPPKDPASAGLTCEHAASYILATWHPTSRFFSCSLKLQVIREVERVNVSESYFHRGPSHRFIKENTKKTAYIERRVDVIWCHDVTQCHTTSHKMCGILASRKPKEDNMIP